jgi:hypothetical protein
MGAGQVTHCEWWLQSRRDRVTKLTHVSSIEEPATTDARHSSNLALPGLRDSFLGRRSQRADIRFSQAHREHSRQIRSKLSRLIQATTVSQIAIGPHQSNEPLTRSKYVSNLTGRIEQHWLRGAATGGRVKHEVCVDRIANSFTDLPADSLKRANSLLSGLVA